MENFIGPDKVFYSKVEKRHQLISSTACFRPVHYLVKTGNDTAKNDKKLRYSKLAQCMRRIIYKFRVICVLRRAKRALKMQESQNFNIPN